MSFQTGRKPAAEPEYPPDSPADSRGWTEIAGIYAVPAAATQAVVELHLRWAPGGMVEWGMPSLTETAAAKPRKVRIAVVHFQPRGGSSNAEQCRLYEPLLGEAARQRADLVVLGETLTYVYRKPGIKIADAAEPVPGPSTEYFTRQAQRHNFYVVAGLVEREGQVVYNTAALVGPEGLVGKYRKVTLPRGEWTQGVAPGREFPVFTARFGKVAMMVCYDGFYPEVARQLSARGAEIIAFPVWGCNPDLARAVRSRTRFTSPAAPTATPRAIGCRRRYTTTRAGRLPWPANGAPSRWPKSTSTRPAIGPVSATLRTSTSVADRTGTSPIELHFKG